MNRECNIIRDLLPLYAEGIASTDTAAFVEEHLRTCADCQAEYERIKEPEVVRAETEALPLRALSRKLRTRRRAAAAFAALLVAAVLISLFSYLSAPVYFPWSEDLLTLTENGDGSVTLTFRGDVTDYRCDSFYDPEVTLGQGKNARCYFIEAWSSPWDRWLARRGILSTTIRPQEGEGPFFIYYASNSGTDDVCLYGPIHIVNGGVVTLPRLALGYYLILMATLFCVLLLVWLLLRRREKAREWLGRFLLYPPSYILAHFIIMGARTTSYSMTRDLALIFILSLLIFAAALLALTLLRQRREEREIGEC